MYRVCRGVLRCVDRFDVVELQWSVCGWRVWVDAGSVVIRLQWGVQSWVRVPTGFDVVVGVNMSHRAIQCRWCVDVLAVWCWFVWLVGWRDDVSMHGALPARLVRQRNRLDDGRVQWAVCRGVCMSYRLEECDCSSVWPWQLQRCGSVDMQSVSRWPVRQRLRVDVVSVQWSVCSWSIRHYAWSDVVVV